MTPDDRDAQLELPRLQRDRAGPAGGGRGHARRASSSPAIPPRCIASAARRGARSSVRARPVAAMVGVAPGPGGVHERRHRGQQSGAARRRAARSLVSAIEHDSVLAAAPDAARIAGRRRGAHRPAGARARAGARAAPALVSVMLANNETGVIQPVRERGRARPRGTARACIATRSRRAASWRSTLTRARRRSPHPLGAQARRPAGRRRARACAPGSSPTPCCAAAARSGAGGPAPRTCRASSASGARASWPWRMPTGGSDRRAARSARGADRRARAGCPGVRARAPSGCPTPRCLDHARGQQPDPADRARPRRHRGQHRLGLLVGQGRPVPRAGRHGHRPGRSGERDPGQPGLGEHAPTTSTASSTPGAGCTSARAGRPPRPGRREAARLLLPPGSRHK